MPTSKTWAMNCVLCGARLAKLLAEGKDAEAREMIASLTSEFEPQDVDYLLMRLKSAS